MSITEDRQAWEQHDAAAQMILVYVRFRSSLW